MKKLPWRGKRAADLEDEAFWLTLHQARNDSYARSLPTKGDLEWCSCAQCKTVRQEWRERTGRI